MTPASARRLWARTAARGPRFGRCDRCGRLRDDDGRPLLVARRQRCRQFLCLSCFSAREAA